MSYYEQPEQYDIQNVIHQKVCMIAVVYVHKARVEQGRLLCKKYGVKLSEQELYDLAEEWRFFWQIDVPRNKRSNCFLCNRQLSPNMEELCRCFREAEIGRFLEPTSLEEVEALIEDYGPDLIVETIQCKDCDKLSSVTLGIIRSRFQSQRRKSSEVRYTSPKRCQKCYNARGQVNTGVREVLSSTVGDRVEGRRKRRSSYPKLV